MVSIYAISNEFELSDVGRSSYLNSFPFDIQKKILGFSKWQDAQASFLGKVLLKKGLEDFKIDSNLSNLKYTSYGRPYIEDALDFNISHSGNWVVCAFSTIGRIGVDVEKISPIPVCEFKSHFLEEEWNLILRSENTYHTFYAYWTAKEAIIKAEGKGLSIPLYTIWIKGGLSVLGQTPWYYKSVSLADNYQMHIASDKPLIDIDLIKLSLDDIVNVKL